MYRAHPRLQASECILLGYRGSIAHGTYVPNSDPNSIDDVDLMGIAVPDCSHYFGLSQYGSRGTVEIVDDPWDIVLYEARKAVSLLAKANPNVLALLWLPEEMIIHAEPAGHLLIEGRDLFATKAAYAPFRGYANGQFKKMRANVFNGYMGAKRKALVEKHGYDTKNASHVVRILRQGIEFLETGEMQVLRSDADELLEIKRGEWDYPWLMGHIEGLDRNLAKAAEASPLPPEPDREAINRLCESVVAEGLAVAA
jgi:predicted nucleotidyltransferase